jgi:threonine aldolase
MQVIDWRSDFLARPSAAMEAAAAAARDSRCFGLREDPWQQRLEARVAQMLGAEDALVFPTCTMANTTALMLQAERGSRVLVPPQAHVMLSEAGAGAALAGVFVEAVTADGSTPEATAMPPVASWVAALQAGGDAQRPGASLCVLENTHNRAGGIPLAPEYVQQVVRLARDHGAKLHLDGARLFDASVALKLPIGALASGFDTVAVSLNKCFGAGIAAVLAGSRSTIERALTIRQRLGGGIRPTGAVSAGALAGLEELGHIEHVHRLAAALAQGLADSPVLEIQPATTRTNAVIARVRPLDSAAAVAARFAAEGVLVLALDAQRIRFTAYRGIDAAHVERTIAVARRLQSEA